MGKISFKNIKYGSNSIIMVAVIIAIAIVLNVLVGIYDYSFDLTSNKLFSLGNQTINVLKNVKKEQEVKVVALYDESNTKYDLYTNILNQYKAYADGKIKFEFFNPTDNPGLFADLGIENQVAVNEQSNTSPFIVVKAGKKSKIITFADLFTETTKYNEEGEEETEQKLNVEAMITGGINSVISDFMPKVYWITGHGEKEIENNYEQIVEYLKLNNYQFDYLNISSSGTIPKDCSMLMCVSPESDWSSDEKDIIYKYLQNGGSLFVMMDAAEKNIEYTNIKKITAEYNISFNNDQIIETSSDYVLSNDSKSFFSSAVATKMNQPVANYKIIVRNARSVKLLSNSKDNVNSTNVLVSTDAAYSEDFKTAERLAGQQAVAAAGDRMPNGITTRIIVMGDSDFMNDNTLTNLGGNSFYTTKTVLTYCNWLQNAEDNLIISPKSVTNNSLVITREQIIGINIATMIIIPLAVLVLGLFIWLKRRHK